MTRLLSLIFRRALMGGIMALIARVLGRGAARNARGAARGVRMFNRFTRR